MSLTYKVLWVDDNKDEFEKEEKSLKKYIEDLFFLPKIDFVKDLTAAKKLIDTEKYDVIFSDYNIDEEKGDDFISFIREKSVNTEVLFYSGQSELPKGRLDRVTFFFETGSHREERLLKKMKELIALTVAKLNDLTQLRGLVMSEVSELDSMMEDIILKYYSDKTLDSEEWKQFKSKILDNAQKSLKKRLIPKTEEVENNGQKIKKELCSKDCTHIWMNVDSIENIVSSFEFDSSKKAHTIHEICKSVDASLSFSFSDYDKNVIQVRNNLAHSKSTIKDGKEILVTKKYGEVTFSQDSFVEIRKNIKIYHRLFCTLQEKLGIEVAE